MMLVGTSAFAQFSAGAGFVNSTDRTKAGGTTTTTGLNGFYAGASYNIPLGGSGLGVAPGLYYSLLTKKDAGAAGTLAVKHDLTEHYLSLPIHLNYGIAVANGVRLGAYAGPTMALGLASTAKVKTDVDLPIFGKITADSKVNNYKDGADYRRFDVLLGGGVACEFEDMVRFEVGYDYGVLDRYTGKSDINRHRSQIHVGVAYLF